MDIQRLIEEGDKQKLKFQAKPAAVAAAVEAQTSLIKTAQWAQPMLSDYVRAEQNIARIAHEISSIDWPNRLLEVSNAAKMLIEAQDTWSRFAELYHPFAAFHELERINADIRASIDAVSIASSLARQSTFIQIYTEGIIRMSDLSQINAVMQAEVLRIRDVFLPTFDAFSAIRNALYQKEDLFSRLRIPTREHFLTADLLHELIVTEKVDELSQERSIAIKDADDQLMATLPGALSKLNPDLYRLWCGAWDSLASENPDRVRHALVSARELITQVLHVLAPDDKVRAWNKSPEYYHKGRPTRAARLLFIHNDVIDPVTKDYFLKEINACLSLIGLLQKGTHDVNPGFSDTHLQVILRRVHFTICTLVEIRMADAN